MAKAIITIWDRPDGSFNVLPQYGDDNVFDKGNVSHVLAAMLIAHIETLGAKRETLTPDEEAEIAAEADAQIEASKPTIILPSTRSIRTH